MSVWLALLFMAIGAAAVELFETRAWRMYQRGKEEGRSECQNKWEIR